MLTLVEQAHKLSWAIAAQLSHDFYSARSQSKLLLQGSRAVQDPAVLEHLRSAFNSNLLDNGVNRAANLPEFVDSMQPWLESHSSNSITGLDGFQADFSAGSTQAFDSFYYRYRGRRMRCLVGEYFYHLKTWISTDTDWAFVTDAEPLCPGDALVVSVPFCDTGSMPRQFDQLIARCEQLNIPVLVDCCYYPISGGVDVDVTSPAIDTVAFSLSKAFPVAYLRIGVRYTRPGTFDGQRLHNSINYNNTLSAGIGLALISKFGSDYIHHTYQERQQQTCDYFELEPSASVLFAVGNSQWSRYNRGNLLQSYGLSFDADQFQNRISLVSIFDHWELLELVKNETGS